MRFPGKPVGLALIVILMTITLVPVPGGAPVRAEGDRVLSILAWIRHAEVDQEYATVRDVLDEYLNFKPDVFETTTDDASTLQTLLSGKDVLLVPEQELANPDTLRDIGAAWESVLDEFLQAGGVMVVLDVGGKGEGISRELLEGAGLLEVDVRDASAEQEQLQVVEAWHPVAKNLPSTFLGDSGTLFFRATDGTEVVESRDTGDSVVVAKDVGAGHLVYIGFDYYQHNDAMGHLLANAVSYEKPEFKSYLPITARKQRLYTEICPKPPRVPYGPSPADNATGLSDSVVLAWSGGHPCVGEPVTYDVYLDANDGTPQTLVCNDVPTPTCGIGTLSKTTHYYWQVVATGRNGPTPGPVWDFWTNGGSDCSSSPNTPSSPGPSDGQADASVYADLSWTGGDPDPSSSVTYDVLFEANNSSPETVKCNDVSSTFCDPGTLLEGTHYYWQVVARDSCGNTKTGPVWDFWTNSTPNDCTSSPYTPSGPGPSDGRTDVGVNTDLTWTGGDPDPGSSVTYDVFFEANDSSPETEICSDVSTTYCDPGTLQEDTQYYWQVVARDSCGNTRSGPVWPFRTAGCSDPPTTPSSPSPGNYANNVLYDVKLKWSGGHPCTGVTVTYDVRLESGDQTPDNVACSNVSNSNRTCDPSGNLTDSSTYYWQIVARDSQGKTTTGPVWRFETRINRAPNLPTNPSPSSGDSDVDPDADLVWSGGDDPDGDSVLYDVYLSQTTNMPAARICTNLTVKKCNPPGTLAYSASYRWYVVVKEEWGKTTTGSPWSFGTAPEDPDPITYYKRYIARHSGKCLDVDHSLTTNGANVIQFDCWGPWSGGDNQFWRAESAGGGYYRVRVKHSQKCLTGSGSNVVQSSCGSGNQLWQFISAGSGYNYLKAQFSGKCLTVSGGSHADDASVVQGSCSSSASQWK